MILPNSIVSMPYNKVRQYYRTCNNNHIVNYPKSMKFFYFFFKKAEYFTLIRCESAQTGVDSEYQ